ALVGLAINPTLVSLVPASKGAVAMCIATLALLAGVLVLAAHPNLGGRLASRQGWLRFMGAVHLGLNRFRHRPWAAVQVLTAGFAYQLSIVLAAFLGGHALGLHVGWTAMLAFVPVVAILQVLPITVSGLGVREGALVLFLNPLGVSTSSAIALGLLLYLMNLLVSLLGAPAFAWGGRSSRAVA
ncbi:MAG TPA: lysylphosphatidylglycerol synthase domain-containing protein, partial [Acidimicrobiales bacterium]|nr:lysylphosphatidylglycerol synthase domain-containing protein [Acidimicrobiales bacterium]